MIIQLESGTAENVQAAKRSLEAMAHSWDQEIAEAPAEAAAAAAAERKKRIEEEEMTTYTPHDLSGEL